jgi:hypothetical protein
MPLKDLTPHEVRTVLVKVAESNSSRTVQIVHNCLERAVRHAELGNHVIRNVVTPVKAPKGQTTGRPSKAPTAEQAVDLVTAAKTSRLDAYIVLCLQTGVRTEEARP